MNNEEYQDEIYLMLDDLNCFISEEECCNDHNCDCCDEIEDCYMRANSRCNSAYAESIDYGGYDSEEEFWDNL